MRNLTSVLIVILLVGVGCNKPTSVDTVNWSKPEIVSQSKDSIGSSFSLYKWNNTVMALNNDAGPFSVYFLQADGKTWMERAGNPADWLPLDVDPSGNRFVTSKGSRYGDNLTVNFLTGLIRPNGDVQITAKEAWKTDKAAFFGKIELLHANHSTRDAMKINVGTASR